jgi:hypothetical protein
MITDGSSQDGQPLSDPQLITDLDKTANRIYMLVGELRALTGWDELGLLKHLGCDATLPLPPSTDTERLRNHSVAYLTWVRDLCYLVDRSVDRHDMLHGAYELCNAAGGSKHDRVERCMNACDAPGREGLSANELMRLGEVAKGWLQATVALDGGAGQQRAERVMELTAPRMQITSHLHPRRLKWLLAKPADRERELGMNVSRRMQEHVDGCPRCEAVVRELDLSSPWRSRA